MGAFGFLKPFFVFFNHFELEVFMKKILMLSLVLSVSAFAGYTHTITEGMEFTNLTLTGTQSLLMTGGKGNDVYLRDSTLMNYSNGEVNRILLSGSATLNISGGTVLGVIDPYGNSIVNISDGYIEKLYVSGWSGSHVTLTGGEFGSIANSLNVIYGIHLTFVCDLNSLVYTYDNDMIVIGVAGNWLDGSSFDIDIKNSKGYPSTIEYIEFIPEPATMLFLAVGGLLIRRK
jgi:hypothetical protein